MFNFEQLAGLKHFKKCIANICEEDIALRQCNYLQLYEVV